MKEGRKRFAIVITFIKSNKSSAVLQLMLNSVALLAECTGRARYLLPGVFFFFSRRSLIAHQTPVVSS